MMSRTLVETNCHECQHASPIQTKNLCGNKHKILNAVQRRRAVAGYFLAVTAACTTAGPFIPDTTAKASKSRENISADDVFKRAPWELWRVPTGVARYHRGTGMLLPDKLDSFEVSDVSVYQKDGSDVRIDYFSVDLGGGAQSHESISVFVYRAPDALEAEWKTVVDDVMRRWPGGTPASPFAAPAHYPNDTKQMALVAPARTGNKQDTTFVQEILFHVGEWAVRFEVTCPAEDLEAAREKTRTFLRSLRAEEYAGRTD
jgi:hypothetical protein